MLEHYFGVEVSRFDHAQTRFAFAPPRSWPAVGVDNRLPGRVSADQAGSKVAGALELGERFLVACGLRQSPVQVQFAFRLPALRVEPGAAGARDDRSVTEDRLEPRAGLKRALVAFGRQDQALGNVGFGGLVWLQEGGDRRREDDLLTSVGGATGPVEGARAKSGKAAVEFDRVDEEGLRVAAVFVKGPERNIVAGRRVAEQRVDKGFQLGAVGLERDGNLTAAAILFSLDLRR